MLTQESEHTPGRKKIPRYRLNIEHITLLISLTLHPSSIPTRAHRSRHNTPVYSAVS